MPTSKLFWRTIAKLAFALSLDNDERTEFMRLTEAEQLEEVMNIYERLDAIETALKNLPTGGTAPDESAAVAQLRTDVDALRAEVGPSPLPEEAPPQ